MAFIRTHKTRDYTVMCNHHLNNVNLSLKAKGLLSFMLSKPDNWEFSISGLQSQLKEGKSSIRKALVEIEEFGYLRRRRFALTNQKGSMVEYHIFEKPNQKSENQTFDNQTFQNRTQVSTDLKVNTDFKELNYIPSNQENDLKADFEINEIEVIEPIEISIINNKKGKEKSSAKKEKHETDFSFHVRNCLLDCLHYFDEDLRPNEKESIAWLETIDKLNRLDQLQFEDIVLIVKATRSDKFWKKNFLSMVKLRRKDKDKIPYWKIFKEKFKFEGSKTQNMASSYDQAKKDLGL